MQQQQKENIIDAANEYIKQHGLSLNDLQQLSKVNIAYLSNMLKMVFEIPGNGKPTPIADQWFVKLAKTIDYDLQKVTWNWRLTPQFQEGVTFLKLAKERGFSGMLIGDTGCGKTYLIDKFIKRNPIHTYRITVSGIHTMPMILNELLGMLGIKGYQRSVNTIALIGQTLKRLKDQGEQPIVIVDEGENLKLPVIRLLKGLYDAVEKHCAIVIIGTHDLLKKLEKLKESEREGIPQFCRRFKANTRLLSPIDRSFRLFFDDTTDKGLRTLLQQLCDNYGELCDYLLPVMIEADEQGKPVTEHFFRLYHNMPK